jgi:hypothetical protein
MSSRIFMLGAVGVVLLAVITGAFVVGSPHDARRQAFDDRRYQELNMLARTLLCTTNTGAVLPLALTAESMQSYCGGRNTRPPSFLDDETNQPYKYTRKSDDEYSICAQFHDSARTARLSYVTPYERWAFDAGSGCITGRIR